MAHFPKPDEGSWTEHFPELGTAPLSFEDSISPEHYAHEREAVFKKTWLNVGRVEQLPEVGSGFSRDIHAAGTTLRIVRDPDGEIRAYYNAYRRSGRRLVENTDSRIPVRCEVWEGFVFVNFDDGAAPLRDYLGRFGKGLEGYPFGEMTRVHTYQAEVNANWKLYMDAFTEFYHAPILHAKQYVEQENQKLRGFGYEGLHYDIDGPHSVQSAWGGMAPPKDPSMVKPIEQVLRSGNFGPWDRPDIPGLDPLPDGVNPSRHRAWGLDSYVFFPNFMLIVWAPGWYLTYHYWPLAYDRHIFEGTLYFVPPKNALERLRQELAVVTFKEFALQDCNTLEATQVMLESRAVTEFPVCDQEIMIRHLHKVANDHVTAHLAASEAASRP